jgi:GNAT superfamily N-acetyltransferase
MESFRIRAPREDELDRLRAIEVDAARRFRELGMDEVASMPPQTVEALAQARAEARLWVAEVDGVAVGMALIAVLDGAMHLAELDVVLEHQGQGIGTALVEHVLAQARGAGRAAVTLHTFRDVPWNAPYYARRGFEVVEAAAMGPELLEATAVDQAHFGSQPRVCMQRRP